MDPTESELVRTVYTVKIERTHFGVTHTYWLGEGPRWRVHWWDRKLYTDDQLALEDARRAYARTPLGDHTMFLIEIRRPMAYEKVVQTIQN